jgi:prepilin-type processing-associated H-X9-DG protein
MSLIEVLVVVAVIGVLAGLLLPAMARSKASARSAKCTSNLKQWGIVWNLYTSDNDGYFSDGVGAGFPRGEWVWSLADHYSEKPELLVCPEATMRRGRGQNYRKKEFLRRIDIPRTQATYFGGPRTVYEFPPHPKLASKPGSLWFSSYGQNNWAYNVRQTLQGRKAEYHWREMDVAWEASEVPLFADAMWRGGGPDHEIGQKYVPPDDHGEWTGVQEEAKHFAIMRHGRGINVLYFDGSVRKTQSVLEVWKMKWHQQFDTEKWKRYPFAGWIR